LNPPNVFIQRPLSRSQSATQLIPILPRSFSRFSTVHCFPQTITHYFTPWPGATSVNVPFPYPPSFHCALSFDSIDNKSKATLLLGTPSFLRQSMDYSPRFFWGLLLFCTVELGLLVQFWTLYLTIDQVTLNQLDFPSPIPIGMWGPVYPRLVFPFRSACSEFLPWLYVDCPLRKACCVLFFPALSVCRLGNGCSLFATLPPPNQLVVFSRLVSPLIFSLISPLALFECFGSMIPMSLLSPGSCASPSCFEKLLSRFPTLISVRLVPLFFLGCLS